MSEKLLPCPFCGGKGILSVYPYDNPVMFAVECDHCKCSMGIDYDNCAMPDFQFGEEDGAIAAWNTRPPNPLADVLRSMKREHIECEDGWYSCPKSEQGCIDDEAGDECTCGADETNAMIDKALREYGKA